MKIELEKPSAKNSYELMVIGGGLAGFCCALAAARKGVKTALIEAQEYLGGNASPSLGVAPEGAMAMGYNRFADETGIMDEIRSKWYKHGTLSCGILAQILWEMVSKEKLINLYIYTRAKKPIMEEDLIKGITIRHLENKREQNLYADLFADCSGDGEIACQAGAKYMLGRESRKTFHEPLAPLRADNGIMGATLFFNSRKLPFKTDFAPVKEAYSFPNDNCFPYRPHDEVRGTNWWLEYATAENILNHEKLYGEHLKILLGFWDHMKNKGLHGCEKHIISYISPYLAKRESRRFFGDYILTQNDVEAGRMFDDRICHGGWPIDLHPPKGIFSKEKPAIQRFVDIYSIPYRCLYSADIRNLFFAGRNTSISHVALGTTRVEWTCGVMGQVIGTAAALCKKYACYPRDVYNRYLNDLQQELLKEDSYIIGLRNKDNLDKARKAKITVSSSRPLKIKDVRQREALKGKTICQTLPVSGNNLDALFLFLENKSRINAAATLRFYKCGDSLSQVFSQSSLCAAAKVTVGKNYKGWVKFPLNIKNLEAQKTYWWSLECQGNTYVCYTAEEIIGCQRGRYNPELGKFEKYVGHHDEIMAIWKEDIGTYAFYTEPVQYPYSAENLTNGIVRPYIYPNIWISDPTRRLPQHIILEFEKP